MLSVAKGRRIVKQVGNLEVEKARKTVEEADAKLQISYKRWFFEAAKEARK